MRLLVINGPNLNMLGVRNKEIYGDKTYKDLCKLIKGDSKLNKYKVDIVQYNSEERIINYIHKNYKKYDGIVCNLGAFTHYSYAIRDALELTNLKIADVHISDINNREEFRKVDVLDGLSTTKVVGEGFNGYIKALEYLRRKDEN